MNYSTFDIVLQEVPGEISLSFTITGCKIHCKGCHSPHLWKKTNGERLTMKFYKECIARYDGFISCVLFMGGEWYCEELVSFLKYAESEGLNTCLYTGHLEVDKRIINHLTWLKIGEWNKELGGLNSKTTNQQFIEVATGKVLNYMFCIGAA